MKKGLVMVECVSERESIPGQVVAGNRYWMDISPSSMRVDSDGDEYAAIYRDPDGDVLIAHMLTEHFIIKK